ncbi:putative integral membrane protein [Peziza echinospora]|nr:putative integral membrane protein [Peziza echinospora]
MSISHLRGRLVAYSALYLILAGSLRTIVSAHEHGGENIPDGSVVSPDPLDTILWLHIVGMITAFGIIFPIGMVLGIVRNRWHVPVQVLGSVIATLSYILGHAHKGRQFAPNIHASFASVLMFMMILQIALGVYLKLHLEKGIHRMVRRKIVVIHGVAGKAMPVVAWIQMLFGGITALGFCRGDHTGNCAAHFIMGSSFIAYGIVMTIMLLVGQGWLRRTGRSPEFWDSLVIGSWVTEHRWGKEWHHNDIQHTAMGIVWWAAGLLGIWLSRDATSRQPRRNLIPGLVIFLTGYAMSAHPQHNPLSGSVHTVFGYTLMAAGLARIVEIAFVLRDRNEVEAGGVSSWQYLTPYLLVASGFLFQAANEEQLTWMSNVGMDHVSYVLAIYSLAFLMFLFTNFLIGIYTLNVSSGLPKKLSSLEEDISGGSMEMMSDRDVLLRAHHYGSGDDHDHDHEHESGSGSGNHVYSIGVNRNALVSTEDVDHFGLEGLVTDSDEEEEEAGRERRRLDRSMDTIGKATAAGVGVRN